MEKTGAASDASQCVRVATNYCGCANGGQYTAINQQYEEAWNRWMERNRPDQPVACPAVYNCYNYTLVVENGTCTIEPGQPLL